MRDINKLKKGLEFTIKAKDGFEKFLADTDQYEKDVKKHIEGYGKDGLAPVVFQILEQRKDSKEKLKRTEAMIINFEAAISAHSPTPTSKQLH